MVKANGDERMAEISVRHVPVRLFLRLPWGVFATISTAFKQVHLAASYTSGIMSQSAHLSLPWSTLERIALSIRTCRTYRLMTGTGFQNTPLREGDIVFSRVGSVDRRALVRKSEEGWLFSGRCLRVRPNRNNIDPKYLSYFFGLPAFQEYIRSIAVGATMPSLNTKILSEVSILYPPPPRAASHRPESSVHWMTKIELNRRLNETLEEMARALFKSWFVDFDPVRAKMEGRWCRGKSLPGLPADLYDLFPDSLMDSELGEIPEAWGVRGLENCIGRREGAVLQGVWSGIRWDAHAQSELNFRGRWIQERGN